MPAEKQAQHKRKPRRDSLQARAVSRASTHPWIAWASPYSTRLYLGPHPSSPTLRALYPSGPTLEGRALRYRRLPHPGASHSMVCAAGGSPAPAQVARCPLRARLRRSIVAGAHAQLDLLRLPGARGRPQQPDDSPRLRAQLSQVPWQLRPLHWGGRAGRGDTRRGRQAPCMAPCMWHRAYVHGAVHGMPSCIWHRGHDLVIVRASCHAPCTASSDSRDFGPQARLHSWRLALHAKLHDV